VGGDCSFATRATVTTRIDVDVVSCYVFEQFFVGRAAELSEILYLMFIHNCEQKRE